MHPNRGDRMNFKQFVRQKAKGPIRDATLNLYDKDRARLQGRPARGP